MGIQVGVVKAAVGIVKAIDQDSGAVRILTVGSPVYQGEIIQTEDASQVMVDMKNGELVTLGRLMSLTLDRDVVDSDTDAKSEGAVSLDALERAVAEGRLEGIDLDDLEEVAAGDQPGSANEGGVVIERLGMEGEVNAGFATSSIQADLASTLERDAQANIPTEPPTTEPPTTEPPTTEPPTTEPPTTEPPTTEPPTTEPPTTEPPTTEPPTTEPPTTEPPEEHDPKAYIIDDGNTLLGLVGANYESGNSAEGGLSLGGLLSNETFVSSPLFGGSGNTPIELGALDLVNYQPDKIFYVEDEDDDIQKMEMTIDNGVGEDLLGLSYILGREEFVAPDENDPEYQDYNYDVSDDGQKVTVTRKDGQPMSDEEANHAMGGVEREDTSTLGSLLNSGVIIGSNYTLYVEDSKGNWDEAESSQFLDVSLLQNGTNSGLSDLLDVPLLNVLDPVTENLDNALGGIDDGLMDTVVDVVDVVDEVTDPLTNVLAPVGDLLNGVGGVVVDLTDTLGESTFLGDPALGQEVGGLVDTIAEPIVNLQGPDLSQGNLATTLLGPEGTVDQLVSALTDILDSLLGTQLSAIDYGEDSLTTDLEELLTGDEDLMGTLVGLLGGYPEQGTAGSVDQLIDGLTSVVDQLLGTNTDLTDDAINRITTDLQELLTGDEDLAGTLAGLLGGDPEQGTAGSADQLVDGVTDVVDQLLGTNTDLTDDAINSVTTDLQELLTGDEDLNGALVGLLGGYPEQGTAGSVDQLVDGLTSLVDQLLGTNTDLTDDAINNVTTDLQELLTGDEDLNGTLVGLLGGYPEQGTAGSADQLVDGVTDVVDQLLGTDTEFTDDGLNLVTTDVQELLTGEDDLGQTVTDLLSGYPDQGTAGSADQLVDGVTDVVDQLLGTDTEFTDDGLNMVTTDVQELLTGDDDLLASLTDLLGGHSADNTAGSADQLVDGVTDVVDQLLGTDTEQVDDLLNEVTTVVSDLLGGNVSVDIDLGLSNSDGGLLSLNLLNNNDNDFNNG